MNNLANDIYNRIICELFDSDDLDEDYCEEDTIDDIEDIMVSESNYMVISNRIIDEIILVISTGTLQNRNQIYMNIMDIIYPIDHALDDMAF